MTCFLLLLAAIVAVALAVKFYGPSIKKWLIGNLQ